MLLEIMRLDTLPTFPEFLDVGKHRQYARGKLCLNCAEVDQRPEAVDVILLDIGQRGSHFYKNMLMQTENSELKATNERHVQM